MPNGYFISCPALLRGLLRAAQLRLRGRASRQPPATPPPRCGMMTTWDRICSHTKANCGSLGSPRRDSRLDPVRPTNADKASTPFRRNTPRGDAGAAGVRRLASLTPTPPPAGVARTAAPPAFPRPPPAPPRAGCSPSATCRATRSGCAVSRARAPRARPAGWRSRPRSDPPARTSGPEFRCSECAVPSAR
jgi:hypothetical protein